jgi:outer membrane protein OmpA-like peptidoglycan-associated protein
MKKLTIGLILLFAVLQPLSSASAAECKIPLGTYKYLFSDGYESYFFNDIYTIRLDSSGTKILQNGDFSISVGERAYQRTGSTFNFSNPVGVYTSHNGSPISFSGKGDFATVVAMAPAGYKHSDEYGTYNKQSNGAVLFNPKRKLADLVITPKNCGGNVVELKYDRNKVFANLGVKKIGDNLVVNLQDDILFDFNSAQITPKASETLKQLAYLVQQDRKGLVVIRGHADSKGDDSYNMKLSTKRAEAVSSWLQSLSGVSSANFVPQGMAEAYPVAANTNPDGSDNPQGRAKNRRVEVLIQTVQGAAIPEPTTVVITQPAPQAIVVTQPAVQVVAGEMFNPAKFNYSGDVVVTNPTTLTAQYDDDYQIAGTLNANNVLNIAGNSTINVGRSVVINATTNITGSGDLNIAGDLVVAAPLVVQGNGDINVSGRIIIYNGRGSITQQGNGDINGTKVYQ